MSYLYLRSCRCRDCAGIRRLREAKTGGTELFEGFVLLLEAVAFVLVLLLLVVVVVVVVVVLVLVLVLVPSDPSSARIFATVLPTVNRVFMSISLTVSAVLWVWCFRGFGGGFGVSGVRSRCYSDYILLPRAHMVDATTRFTSVNLQTRSRALKKFLWRGAKKPLQKLLKTHTH